MAYVSSSGRSYDLNLPSETYFLGPASIWKRVAAFFVDLAILDFFVFSNFRSVISNFLTEFNLNNMGFSASLDFFSSNSGLANAFFMIFLLLSLFAMVYFILLQYLFGQTVGDMIMGIKVVSFFPVGVKRELDSSDVNLSEFTKKIKFEPVDPSFFACFVRNLFVLPFMPFILLWIIDPLFMFFNKNNQRFSEFISGTLVVEKFVY